jgi:putative membrane protein
MSDPNAILLFLSYFGVSILLFAAFLAAHSLVTHIKEWDLIRSGNTAAALSLGGAMIGFALPLASAISHSAGLADMVVTAAVASVVQLLCFAAMRLMRRDASAALMRGDMAEGILLAAVSVALGMLNAACLG